MRNKNNSYNYNENELIETSARVRYRTVELIHKAGAGHTGGDMSSADILIALYTYMNIFPLDPQNEDRDYFVLSKGHSAEIYYEVLAEFGYFSRERLKTIGSPGTLFGGHPTNDIPGVEANTGSLGHGLGFGSGIALGLKRNSKSNQVYVLTGDGELAEGSNWEAALFAGNYQLDNFTWIIDRNHLQISGTTEEVITLEPLKEKIKAFGFNVHVIDGHNFKEIFEALDTPHNNKPKAIIANTIKAHGIRGAENDPGWHHRVPNKEEVKQMKLDMQTIIDRSKEYAKA